MDSSREERRLQRQRGAQRHRVQNVDFGSPFPIAAVSQRITRSGATPQPDLPTQPSNRRTPAARSRGRVSNARSTRKRSTPTPTPSTNDANRSANTSAKRRKLDNKQDMESSSPTRSTRSRATPRADLYDLAEEEQAAESAEGQSLGQTVLDNIESGEELDQVQPTQTQKFQQVRHLRGSGADEVIESPRNAPGSGERQKIQAKSTQIPGVRLFENVGQQAPMAQMTDHSNGPFTKLAYRRSPRNRELSSAVDELSPDRPSKSRLEFQQNQFLDVEGEEENQADAINDVRAPRRLHEKQKRKSGNDETEWEAEVEEPERDDEEQEEVELSPEPISRPTKAVRRKKSKAKASPAAQRQPKKKPKSKSASRGERIPVVVHRLTKPVLYGEDDTDADLLNEDVPFAKRSGVNAVDVLSQFCEEVVESGLAALEEGGSNAEGAHARKEYRTKLRAVEAFQEELRTRLLELTVTLDADYLLHKRVKAAQKEKIELRENLLRIRAEREKLALRMDEVRIKHEHSSKEAQEQAALSNALHDIELAVSRGLEKGPTAKADEPVRSDLSIVLRTVAEEVSSSIHEGGILKQVKQFNAFLERAALALEERA